MKRVGKKHVSSHELLHSHFNKDYFCHPTANINYMYTKQTAQQVDPGINVLSVLFRISY